MSGYGTALIATLCWFSHAAPEQASGDRLCLTVEPVKKTNILYEPVVVKITLENLGEMPVEISATWIRGQDTLPWDSGALRILAAPIFSTSGQDDEMKPPPENAYHYISPIMISDYGSEDAVRFIPHDRRLHYHHLVWWRGTPTNSVRSGHHIMRAPGIMWVKARFYRNTYVVSKSSAKPEYVESKALPIRFGPVPEDERLAAEVWSDPSLGCYIQHGWDATKRRVPREKLKQTLRDFVRQFPDSAYTPYARKVSENVGHPILWAEAYYHQASNETSPLQLTLHVPKPRYLFAEPFLLMAELKNVSEKPVEIDPRLEHAHGWMTLFTIPNLELKRQRLSEGMGAGFPLYKMGEPPIVAEPKNWQPVTLSPGESTRKVFFFPYVTKGQYPSALFWAEYWGGPTGVVQSNTLKIEIAGTPERGYREGEDFPLQAIRAGVPEHEVEPLSLWYFEQNVTRFLEHGDDHDFPDRRSGRAVLNHIVKQHPASLYSFYARAALENPKDWGKRLMNDPATKWPQVTKKVRTARVGLITFGSGVLLLIIIIIITAAVLIRFRRPSSSLASVTSDVH